MKVVRKKVVRKKVVRKKVAAPFSKRNLISILTEVEGGEDVLLRVDGVFMLAAEHQLGVVHDEHGEDDGPERSVSDHRVPKVDHVMLLECSPDNIGAALRC
jgi:hypothetical protein